MNTSHTTLFHSDRIPSPCFVIDERLLRQNLDTIAQVSRRAGVEIIMAFKAFAMWKVFPIIKEYVTHTTASSLAEARLSVDKFGNKAHLYAPAYTDGEFDELVECSTHITFNSLAQFEKYYGRTQGRDISCGLRINPEISVVETDLYNPAKAGSRLGITAEQLPEKLPDGVEGLHFHVLCENSSFDLEKVLVGLADKFDRQPAAHQRPPRPGPQYGRRTPDDPQGLQYQSSNRSYIGFQTEIPASAHNTRTRRRFRMANRRTQSTGRGHSRESRYSDGDA